MKKKILVTGSNGLLGQKITDIILQRNNFELIATSLGTNRHVKQSGYIYHELDICNPSELAAVITQHHPDAIINTAAMTNVDLCEKEQEQCFQLNVVAVENLIKICARENIQLIHLSTDFIFDGKNGPYSETDAPKPLSYYGQSKWEAEKLLINSLSHFVILRTIIVYGVANNMSRSNIVLWAKSALEKGETLRVVNDQWRMPTLAEDLAECCLLAVNKEAQGIFNVSGKDMMNMVELVQRVANFWNLNTKLIQPITSDSLAQTAKRPSKTGFILDKAIKELDYQPHSFEEGLAILDNQLKAEKFQSIA